MDIAGDAFFTSATFSKDQYRGIEGADFADLLEDAEHAGILANDAGESLAGDVGVGRRFGGGEGGAAVIACRGVCAVRVCGGVSAVHGIWVAGGMAGICVAG